MGVSSTSTVISSIRIILNVFHLFSIIQLWRIKDWSSIFLTRVISRLHEPMKSSDWPCQLTSRSYTKKETLVWKNNKHFTFYYNKNTGFLWKVCHHSIWKISPHTKMLVPHLCEIFDQKLHHRIPDGINRSWHVRCDFYLPEKNVRH